MTSKYFKDKIFAGNPKTMKSAKIFPFEIFRLYGTYFLYNIACSVSEYSSLTVAASSYPNKVIQLQGGYH